MERIIIVGGGAAGFFAGISAATHNPRHHITILEARHQPLAKVRISGGGRCNVTHHCFNPTELVRHYPRGAKELRGAFSRFQPRDTVNWFENQGVALKTEADGRMFPVTDKSDTIVECLTQTAARAGIEILTGTPVKEIARAAEEFVVELKSGKVLKCDRLSITTGSSRLGYTWAKSFGHQIEQPIPSLFTFKIREPPLGDLAGISVEKVRLTLLNTGKNKIESEGSLLITHWGISGPAVLKLSAWGAKELFANNYKLPLQINWLPDRDRENLEDELGKSKQLFSRKKIVNYNNFSLPKRLWEKLVLFADIDANKSWAELSKQESKKLLAGLSRGRYQIEGKGVFKEEFVTCGGVSLKEINFKTMESKLCQGLYFAGEILDIDGVTGGFNFQSAWTTGWLAGKAMADGD